MTSLSTTAIVLAAGLGTRLQPMTLTKPKPLVEVGRRSMLDHALDKLIAAGVQRVIVNTFYLPEQIEAHLALRRDVDIVISRETELLDTGGAIKNVLPYFEGKPFFCLNADLPWMDADTPSLKRMKAFWRPDDMDALLLLMPTKKARGFGAEGDFALAVDGRASREGLEPSARTHVMVSAQIMKPEFFSARQDKVFSNRVIWHDAETRHRLFGLEHDGTCFHVGTVPDWQQANDLLSSGAGWTVHD